jgi:hypothetical protein
MARAGILSEDAQVELIEGEIVEISYQRSACGLCEAFEPFCQRGQE